MLPVTSGLVISLNSDGAFVLAGSTVSSWLDESSAGNTVFALGDPQLVLNQTPTGLPAVVLDGDGDLLQRQNAVNSIVGLPSASADRTVFLVVDYVATESVSAGFSYGDNQANQAFGLVANKNNVLAVQGYGGSNDFPSGVNGVNGGFLVQSAVLSGDVVRHYKDGALIDTDAHTYATDVQEIVLGADISGNGEAQMKIAALLVYDRALSETERDEVEAYLQAKYISGPMATPPVAQDDDATTTQGTSVLIDVLVNDTATEADSFGITAIGAPSHGSAALDDGGTPSDPSDDQILYTPDPGYTGADQFTYTISDDDGDATATVRIVVGYAPGLVPPDAVDDSATTTVGAAVLIDVLANDFDPDEEPFAISQIGTPSSGTATLDDGGTPSDPSDDRILYTPPAGFSGLATFTYAIEGDDGEDSATVSVTVLVPADQLPPTAVNDSATTSLDAAVLIDVLANDSDPAGESFAITAFSQPSNGTVALDNGGTPADPGDDQIRYTPAPGFTGQDSFTYTIADDDGEATATVSVSVTPPPSQGPLPLEGFSNQTVLTRSGIEADFQPISMAFLPDNRMLLLSKTGVIRIVDPETGNSSVYMTVNADTNGERGLLDITLDPDFETNGYFYLYYTPADPGYARIARFQHVENAGGLSARGDVGSEFEVWRDTDGYIKCCHFGAGLDFGPDGKLWLTAADKFQSSTLGEGNGDDRMLDLTSSTGKIIRINADGTIPDGSDGWAANPFIDGPGGNDDSVWAYGLRNPFRARWDLEYGQMYIAEVGGNQQEVAHDDLHTTSLDQAGAFYGWPFYEGTPNTFTSDGRSNYDPADFPQPDNDIANAAEGDFYSSPIWSLPHNGQTNSLTGGEVYRGDMFPDAWNGVYFYGNYTKDYIRYLVLDETGLQVLGDYAFLPSDFSGDKPNDVVSIVVGEDGALYYARIASGIVGRIVFEGSNTAPQIASPTVTPATGDLPLEVTFTTTVTDADGDTMTYVVNFGDGSAAVTGTVPASGLVSVTHTYTTDGLFDVAFSVSDGDRTSFASTIEVEAGDVNSAPEIAGAGSDVAVAEPATTEVTFTATVTDADGDPMTYTWHFGDGESVTGVVPADGIVTASHVYASEGPFDAYLQVSDGTTTTVSGDVTVIVGEAVEFPVGAGLVLLLEADIKIGLGAGNTVTNWLDGSGQGNNLAALGNPQLLDNQTPTGKQAIVFDGDGDLLQRVHADASINGLPSGSADRTVFLVVDYVAAEDVSAGVSYGDNQANQAFGLVANKKGQLTVQGYGGSNDFPSGVNGVTGGFLVQSAILSAGLVSHYRNGVLIDSDQHTYATDIERLVLGADISGNGEAQMKISAVLIYNRALSQGERSQVEAFLQSKYISGTVAAPPNAVADTATTQAGTPVVIDVLGNDSDPDGDAFTITAVGAPSSGVAVIDDGGTPSTPGDDHIIYTPSAGFVGQDSFTYTITGDDGSGTAIVTVTVEPTSGSNPPVAVSDTATTAIDAAVLIDVLANDYDPDGEPFVFMGVTQPANGAAAIDDGGTPGDASDDRILYTPAPGFTGTDTFSYTIADDDGEDTATVTVTVQGGGGGGGGLVEDGLVAAYQTDGQVSTSGNLVIGWLDESGFGNDLEASGDPTLVLNRTPTGAAAISFDGSGDFLERLNTVDTLNALPSGSADRTMYFVVNYTGSNRQSVGLAYGDGERNQTFGLTTERRDQSLTLQGGGGTDFDSGVSSAGWLVQSVVLDDNVFRHYRDGAVIGTGANAFATDLQRLVIGQEISGLAAKSMDVAAALIYDRALSDPERLEVETYLQNKYIDDAFAIV